MTEASKKNPKWPAGPWDDEPDKRIWLSEATGYYCLLNRSDLGMWCGYVGIPEGHAVYGKTTSTFYDTFGSDFGVHGGITWSAPGTADIGILDHKGNVRPLWMVGFDCGHGFDTIPGLIKTYEGFEPLLEVKTYRAIEYATEQTELLASGLKALEKRYPNVSSDEPTKIPES